MYETQRNNPQTGTYRNNIAWLPLVRGLVELVGLAWLGAAGCASAPALEPPSTSPPSSSASHTPPVTLSVAPAAASLQPARFVQDRFAISFWVHPPADERMEERYREIAGAGFNVVLGGPETPERISRQLDLCQKLGLKAIVPVPDLKMENLAADHPALWGYTWRDEPSVPAFEALSRDTEQVRQARPGKLLFINLFPNYASKGQLGASTYDEYVQQFAGMVKPSVLCMDHYPRFRPDEKDGRDNYCKNLAVMRSESLRAGIPFWNFFNAMPYGDHTDPTEAQLRWQIYASLAYGAKGVLYFCYFTPDGGEFPKGGAIIARDGRQTRHYQQAKRLNAELLSLGPTLMDLTSTRTLRIEPGSDAAMMLAGGPIRNLRKSPEDPKPDYLVGEFIHKDGRRAVLLQNYHFAYSAWPTVDFDAPLDKVVEIDKVSGREIPVRDDSPIIEGAQISLDAGEGRLFLLPPAASRL